MPRISALLFAVCVWLWATVVLAASPFTLEQIFNPPYPYGSSMQSVSLSDDGAWLACGWDASARSHRDLWVLNTATGAWYQRTDYWTEREARLRREFARDLRKARADWDKAHPQPDAAAQNAAAATQATADAKKDEFDEQKRIDDFEKSLKQQSLNFGGIGQTLFLRDSHELLWNFEGQIYSLDLDQPEAEPVLRLKSEQGFGGMSLVPRDSTGAGMDVVMFDCDADTLLWYPHGGEGYAPGTLRQLTLWGDGNRPNNQGQAITPDLAYFAYITRDYSATRKVQLPDLLADDPYMTQSQLIRPGDTQDSASLTLLDLSATPPWPIQVQLPDAPNFMVGQIVWSPLPGERKLLLGVITIDTHELKVYEITPPASDEAEAQVTLLYREHDDKWLNWDRTSVQYACDGSLILQSEKDGKAQLYRLVPKPEPAPAPAAAAEDETPAPAAEAADTSAAPTAAAPTAPEDTGTLQAELLFGTTQEITTTWIFSRSLRAIVQTAEPDPSCRTLSLLDLATGQAAPLCQADLKYRNPVAINDAETTFIYDVSDERHMSNVAMLKLPMPGTAPTPAPDCMLRDRQRDGSQAQSGWQEWCGKWDVRFITVPGSAGPIAVKLHLPPGWRADGTYPLLLWAHGAGYAETVTRSPGYYEMFHQWLAFEHGWMTAEVDYRGSEGYGRQWRTDVWGRLGELEVEDLVAVKHYLIDNYGADAKKTALWGWSYGGYLTLMALGMKPGEFPVGCSVAPVTRWENYHSYFSMCRLGLPADNPKEYERSSAETYLKDIKDHLLIIHGLRDSNTVFQSVAKYLEKGHELGIDIELKLFPSDDHGIGNEHHFIRVFEAIVNYAEAQWE